MANTTQVKKGVAPTSDATLEAPSAENLLVGDKVLEVLAVGIAAAVPVIAPIIAHHGESWITAQVARLEDLLARKGKSKVGKRVRVALWASWAYNQLVDDATIDECVEFANAFVNGATGHLTFKEQVIAGYDTLVADLDAKKAANKASAEVRESVNKSTTVVVMGMADKKDLLVKNSLFLPADVERVNALIDALRATIKS